jgi:hypothetical protein
MVSKLILRKKVLMIYEMTWQWLESIVVLLSILDIGLLHLGVAVAYSRYSDRLRAGRPRARSSSPTMGKNFLYSVQTVSQSS